MNSAQQTDVFVQFRRVAIVGAALALIGLGALNLAYGDTLLQWQPAPEGATWKAPLGYVSGVILIAAGAGLFVSQLQRAMGLVAALWLAAWAVFLHLPDVVASKAGVASLNGLAENAAMAIGLATLAIPADRRWIRALRIGFGLCCITFGTAHFVYADFTAQMVPAWLPARLALAYLTGAIHFGTGLCLAIGFVPRIAAAVEGAMMASFVLLVHLPRVVADPRNRLELTMLGIALLLTASAWLVATLSTPATRKF